MTESPCEHCGSRIPGGSRFCPDCGSSLGGGRPAAAAAAAGPEGLWEVLMHRLREAAAPRYRILRLLGSGGMAGVYLGEEPRLARKVAIKVMAPSLMVDPRMVERFQQEARSTARLSHPHIVTIHEIDERDGLHYFVMSYVDGPSLEHILKEAKGPLPVSTVRRWLLQIAGALNHAHRSGIVHRDVKPGNVMVDPDGNAVVTDFGIAKVADEPGLTRTGMLVGTPSYMSPEQCMGEEVASAADQYALGALAYHLLTGRPPFAGQSMAVLQAHLSEVPRPILELRPDCPPALAELVHRMLGKKPADRWASMTEVVDALGDAGETSFTNHEVQAVPPPGRSVDREPAGQTRRFAGWKVLAGVGVPIVLVAMVLLLRNGGEGDGSDLEGTGPELSSIRAGGETDAANPDDPLPAGSGINPGPSDTALASVGDEPERGAIVTPPVSVPSETRATTPSTPAPAREEPPDPVQPPATVEIVGPLPTGARLTAVGNAGTIPLTSGGAVQMPPGRYVFEATAEGFQGDRAEVDLVEGQRFRWTPSLAPIPATVEAPPTFEPGVVRQELESSLASLAAAFRSRNMDRVIAQYPSAPEEWLERFQAIIVNTDQARDLDATVHDVEHLQTGPEGAEVRFVLALSFVDFRNRANEQRYNFIASFVPGSGRWILSNLRSVP
jgi:serine/threonine protein kinase